MLRKRTRIRKILAVELLDDRLCPSAYAVTDLGTLGGTYSSATALNQSDQIVGTAYISGNTASHAFLWQNGAMTDLGGFGGTHCSAGDINDFTQVVGEAETGAIDANGLAVRHAFFWQNGAMTDLGTFGGPSSTAHGINNAGQAVGDANTTSLDANGFPIWHAFVWQNGVMTDLNNLIPGATGWVLTNAGGINDIGQIIGEGKLNGQDRAFLFNLNSATITNLGTFGGPRSAAYAINSGGQVAGWANNARGDVHGFRYSAGVTSDLGTLGSGNYSVAYGINNVDQVVGESTFRKTGGGNLTPTYHAFIWQNGQMRDLNGLIPNHSGWTLTRAAGIGPAGPIVGWGDIANQTHAFLLTPTSSVFKGPSNEPGGRYWKSVLAAANTQSLEQYQTGDHMVAVAAPEKPMVIHDAGDSNDWVFLAITNQQIGRKHEMCRCVALTAQPIAQPNREEEFALLLVDVNALTDL